MRLNKLLRLHKHATRATAGVVDAATIRLDHLHQQFDHGLWRVKLASTLALRVGKLAEKVFVDAAKNIFGAALFVAQADRAYEVDKFTQALLIKRWASVVLRQHALQWRILV